MASDEHAMKDLTCSICVDIFREPVTLQCGHSYCRECLQKFTDKSTSSTTEHEHDCPTNELTISCPVCRSPVNLGHQGPSGLAVNQELLEAVLTSQVKGASKDTFPCCSMCEDEEKLPAFKFCPTCGVLYCERCLPDLHPMRGPLNAHILISAEEYLSKQAECESLKVAKSKPRPSCPHHNELFSDFCFTCQELLCNDCLLSHKEHKVADITSAFEEEKKQMAQTLEECMETTEKLSQCDEEFSQLITNNEENGEQNIVEVDKAFRDAREALDNWRRNLVESIKRRHHKRHLECEAVRNNLTANIEMMTGITNMAHVTNALEFLQELEEMNSKKRIDDQLFAVRKVLEISDEKKDVIQQGLKLDVVRPKHIVPRELFGGEHVPTHFSSIQHQLGVSIQEEDKRLIIDWNIHKNVANVRISNNSKFSFGKVYWEFEVLINQVTAKSSTMCISIGVVCSYGRLLSSPGESSWGINLKYNVNECRCEIIGQSTDFFQSRVSATRPHKIGFFLDHTKKTLVVIDCNDDHIICSLQGLVNPPWSPAIRIEKVTEIPVRLVECDSSIFPHVLREMLERD